jgi:hypothetical protein
MTSEDPAVQPNSQLGANEATTAATPLLTDTFTYNRRHQLVKVSLFEQLLKFYNLKSTEDRPPQPADLILSLNDVAGVSVNKGHAKSDQKAYLSIYTYIKVTSDKKCAKRKRNTIELAQGRHATFSDNLTVVYEWQKQINAALSALLLKRSNAANRAWLENIPNAASYLDKPFLIFVNPKSGSGRAQSIYYERVLPVWAESSTKDVLVLTSNYLFLKNFS